MKNKGFALPGVLMLLSVILITLQGVTMVQMSEIKYRGKIMKDLNQRIVYFNNAVKEGVRETSK